MGGDNIETAIKKTKKLERERVRGGREMIKRSRYTYAELKLTINR